MNPTSREEMETMGANRRSGAGSSSASASASASNEIESARSGAAQGDISFDQFMAEHSILGDRSRDRPAATNTKIGNRTMGIGAGSYHISDEDYPQFLQLYYNETFCRSNPPMMYLTEIQKPLGPVVVDLDLKYSLETPQRFHTYDHIEDLITLYMDELSKIFVIDPYVSMDVFWLEKPDVNPCPEREVTKDGIHLFFGVLADRAIQTELRSRVIARVRREGGWIGSSLPIVNDWEDVFDKSVSTGHAPWQLIGSRKPGHDAYAIRMAFRCGWEYSAGSASFEEEKGDSSNNSNNNNLEVFFKEYDEVDFPVFYERMSARHCHMHPHFRLQPEFAQYFVEVLGGQVDEDGHAVVGSVAGGRRARRSAALVAAGANRAAMGQNGYGRSLYPSWDNEQVLLVRDATELRQLESQFLNSLSLEQAELRDMHKYTMALPADYYTDYAKWIRVGWALRNKDSCLFLTWTTFSAQWSGFRFENDLDKNYDLWEKMEADRTEGLTERSLIHWCKTDNYAAYRRIRGESYSNIIDLTLSRAGGGAGGDDGVEGGNASNISGSTEYDLAKVLHFMFKDSYVCASVRGNTWYMFSEHRWEPIDGGTFLRNHISEEMRKQYTKKTYEIQSQLNALQNAQTDEEKARFQCLHGLFKVVSKITEKLGGTKTKDNIMKEARELFYDRHFHAKLDANPKLLAFTNGVVDFEKKCFRPGLPEDYLSKCTRIAYHPLKRILTQGAESDPREDEIEMYLRDFMHKLFPDPELERYMWEHLASVLIGGNEINQTFNMYVGVGQNGKSVLVTLMEKILGDYKGDVPLTLITQQRAKVGGVTPEIVQLKGIRYAVMQEPSKGDRINEGMMKQMTSGLDPLQGRAPYMPETITFVPHFKLVVCTNELMNITSNDHGTWRRICVVDFVSLFTDNPVNDDPEKPHQFLIDRELTEKFNDWKEVFMAMLVERAYERMGKVAPCDSVLRATINYRKSQDNFCEFVEDNIIVDAQQVLSKQALLDRFRKWYADSGIMQRPPKPRELIEYLEKKRGFRFQDSQKQFVGIRLRDELDIAAAAEAAAAEAAANVEAAQMAAVADAAERAYQLHHPDSPRGQRRPREDDSEDEGDNNSVASSRVSKRSRAIEEETSSFGSGDEGDEDEEDQEE